VLGPFYVPGSPTRDFGENIAEQPSGTPAYIRGRVLNVEDGSPIADAELDIWQNGDNRLYAVQDTEAPKEHLRGRFRSRSDGTYAFWAVRPVPYTIPDDGPVGKMLAVTGRHPWRPAHIHMIVRAPGYRTLVTHIFDAASEWLDSDTVFAVKPSLMRAFEAHAPGEGSPPPWVDGEWCSLDCDIVLASGAERTIVDLGRTA
jgi:catechol 1,2-dioxygenase